MAAATSTNAQRLARTLTPSRRRVAGEAGATLVEFAMVFPLLAMLLFGTLTGGIVLDRKMTLTHATREAARYGATVPASQFPGNTWAEHVRQVAVSRSGGLLETADVCVALISPTGVTLSQAGSGCPFPDGATTGQRVQVVVTRPDGADVISGIFFQITPQLSSSATAQHEQ